jgi:hypothetical protein
MRKGFVLVLIFLLVGVSLVSQIGFIGALDLPRPPTSPVVGNGNQTGQVDNLALSGDISGNPNGIVEGGSLDVSSDGFSGMQIFLIVFIVLVFLVVIVVFFIWWKQRNNLSSLVQQNLNSPSTNVKQ